MVLHVFLLFLLTTKIQNTVLSCSTNQFECENGNCVPLPWTCDGENDCDDESDEGAHCTESYPCKDSEFECSNSRCIPQRWICDGENDCLDDSDEAESLCKNRTCGNEEWTCESTEKIQCISLSWICDNHTDCEDGSDERNCNTTCYDPLQFTCQNGKCITREWICNQEDDCGDGSDETYCLESSPCKEDEFNCGNEYCINKRWRCDGDIDCPNSLDERNCDDSERELSRANHTQTLNCTEKEFLCLSGSYCIILHWVCDGEADCPDGSDEFISKCGGKKSRICRSDQFQCTNDECIPGHLACSGEPECTDNSDEFNCTQNANVPLTCNATTEFDCHQNGLLCISQSLMCDGQNDCGNWEDEPKESCDVNECLTNNGDCEQLCVNEPLGHRCACFKGYELTGFYFCRDINECSSPGICSQTCFNRIGSFKCDCKSGYRRDPIDKTRCRALEGHASLLFAHKNDIRKMSLEKLDVESLVNDTKSSLALDFIFRLGLIFWSDALTQKIYKAPIDEGYKQEVLLNNNVLTADGLACDWIYEHIYWTDSLRNTINMANLDGSLFSTIIQKDLEAPRAIALHPAKGWLFWSDWGTIPRIERAAMDGSLRKTLIRDSCHWPSGITLDLESESLYWIDAKLHSISVSDIHGQNRRVVLGSENSIKHPFSISIFEDWMYWTDWGTNSIFKANKFNGSRLESLNKIKMKQLPMGLQVYHPNKQMDDTNHCLPFNGRCSHLCVPIPNEQSLSMSRTACVCPNGFKLSSNSVYCIPDLFFNPRTNYTQSSKWRPLSINDYFQNKFFSPIYKEENEENVSNNKSTTKLFEEKQETNSFPPSSLNHLLFGLFSGGLLILFLLSLFISLTKSRLLSSFPRIHFENPVYVGKCEESSSFHSSSLSEKCENEPLASSNIHEVVVNS